MFSILQIPSSEFSQSRRPAITPFVTNLKNETQDCRAAPDLPLTLIGKPPGQGRKAKPQISTMQSRRKAGVYLKFRQRLKKGRPRVGFRPSVFGLMVWQLFPKARPCLRKYMSVDMGVCGWMCTFASTTRILLISFVIRTWSSSGARCSPYPLPIRTGQTPIHGVVVLGL